MGPCLSLSVSYRVYLFALRKDQGQDREIRVRISALLITGNDLEHIATLKRILVEQYEVTTYEKLASFLGININHEHGVLSMDIRAKIVDLFNKHAILAAVQKDKCDVPINDAVMDIKDADVNDTKIAKFSAVDKYIYENYASINGSMIYMAITCRADITFAIGKTSRGMHKPQPRHISMIRMLLGYLWKTRDFKLHYYSDGNNVRSLFGKLAEQDKGITIFSGCDGQHCDPALAGMADASFAPLSLALMGSMVCRSP